MATQDVCVTKAAEILPVTYFFHLSIQVLTCLFLDIFILPSIGYLYFICFATVEAFNNNLNNAIVFFSRLECILNRSFVSEYLKKFSYVPFVQSCFSCTYHGGKGIVSTHVLLTIEHKDEHWCHFRNQGSFKSILFQ